MFVLFLSNIIMIGFALNLGFKDGQARPDARNFFDSRPQA